MLLKIGLVMHLEIHVEFQGVDEVFVTNSSHNRAVVYFGASGVDIKRVYNEAVVLEANGK